MRTDNFFASMTGTARQLWLTRTEQEILDAKAWLARCRRERLSTAVYGAEITLEALMERKANLLKGSNVAAALRPSTTTAQPKSASARSDSDAQRQRFWQLEYEAWAAKVHAEAKEREERDAWLRNVQWFRL